MRPRQQTFYALWSTELGWGIPAPILYPSRVRLEQYLSAHGMMPLRHGWEIVEVRLVPAECVVAVVTQERTT